MNELDQLYQQVILDHSRERHGQGLLEAPQGDSFQVNPTCGDEVQLQVRLEGQTLAELGWQGRMTRFWMRLTTAQLSRACLNTPTGLSAPCWAGWL